MSHEKISRKGLSADQPNFPFLISAYFSLFTLGMIDMARGPIYPEFLKHFQVSTTLGSLFFTVASIAGLAANLTCPWWMKRWGSYKSLRVFTALQFIGCVGVGAASYLPNSFSLVLFFAALFGLSLGGLGIIINVLVVESAPQRMHNRLLSGVHTMYGLAALLAPVMVTYIIAKWSDWQYTFFVIAAAVGALLIYSTFFVRSGFDSTLKTNAPEPPRIKDLSSLGWSFALIMAFYVGAEMILSTRMVVYLLRQHEFSFEQASLYLTLFFTGLMIGRLSFALLPLKVSSLTLLQGSLFISLVGYAVGFFASPWGFVFCGLSMSVFFPTLVASISENRPKESGQIIALGMTGVSVILIIMHWTFGLIADLWNMRVAMTLGPLFLLVAIILLLFCRSQINEQSNTSSI